MKRLRSEQVVSMETTTAAAKEESSLNKTLRFVKEVKETLGGGGETQESYRQFLNLFLDFHANRITIDALLTRLTQLFYGHKHLILMFNALHSKNHHRPPISSHHNNNNNISNKSSSSSNNISDYEEDGSDESLLPKKKKKKKIIKRDFFSEEKANNREGDVVVASDDDDDVYQRGVAVISEQLQGDPDHDHVLLEEQDACCGGEKTKKKEYKDAIDFFTRISKRLHKYDDYEDERAYRLLLDTMTMFGKRQVTASGVYSRVGLILEKYPDLFDEFKQYFLSEFSEEELRFTPIYLILPNKDDDEVIIGGADHQDHQEVLNNNNVCVSAAAIGGDGPKEEEERTRRKEYEDHCEDELLEMDLLLETLISTTQQLKQCLAKYLKKNSVVSGPILKVNTNIIEQHLKPRNLTCIKNVYGGGARGKDVIDLLKQRPKAALPVVLVRLTQKQKELKKFRSDFKYGMSFKCTETKELILI